MKNKIYKLQRKLKTCEKCGFLDYHYGKSKFCKDCNNGFDKTIWN